MGAGYVLLAGVALYFILLRSLGSARMTPLRAAVALISGYYFLLSVIMAIEYSARGIPLLPNLLDPLRIFTALVQFAVALMVFYKVDADEDSYMSFLVWGAAGMGLIFFVVPPFAQQLLAGVLY